MSVVTKTAGALALLAAAGVWITACSSAEERAPNTPANGNGDSGPTTNGNPNDIDAGAPQGTIGKLRGKVLAPDGKTPLAGALVVFYAEAPPEIPTGLHCDQCVALDHSVPFALSNADGTFELTLTRAGSGFLSVQKGDFRRVRALDVISGDQDAPSVMTTLPAKNDKAKGDSIPRMAVVKGQWDAIEHSLTKLGIAEFDLLDNGDQLLQDSAQLAQYQIVLLPCSGSAGVTCNDARPGDASVQSALKKFVEDGGRLYATDYSYEFVRQLWPEPISWAGESGTLGTACQSTSYDAPGVVEDSSLHDWLDAVGDQSVTLKASWTTINSVKDVGEAKTHVWMSAQKPDGEHPATVSFQRGCGRVLYSTYHTAGEEKAPLLAQEKALLFVLLEVGVCVENIVPK